MVYWHWRLRHILIFTQLFIFMTQYFWTVKSFLLLFKILLFKNDHKHQSYSYYVPLYLPGYHLQGMIIHLVWLKISFSFIYKHLRKALLSNFRFKVGYLVEIFRFGCYNSKYRICRISWKKLADLEMFSWIRIGYRFSNSNIWKCFTKPWQF